MPVEWEAGADTLSATLWDRVWDADAPLPYPRHLPTLKDWKNFCRHLMARIEGGLGEILAHVTGMELHRLSVSGGLGIFGILRGIEFLRRLLRKDGIEKSLSVFYHTLKDNVVRLTRRAELVFMREMWRQWAGGSLWEHMVEPGRNLVLMWNVMMDVLMQDEAMSDEQVCFCIY